jgi:hypothetical protein
MSRLSRFFSDVRAHLVDRESVRRSSAFELTAEALTEFMILQGKPVMDTEVRKDRCRGTNSALHLFLFHEICMAYDRILFCFLLLMRKAVQ